MISNAWKNESDVGYNGGGKTPRRHYASTFFILSESGVVSGKTGDAGIALYAVLALSSATGVVWVTRKRKDEE